MSINIHPTILKAIDALLTKPKMSEKAEKMISANYVRNDAEISWSLTFVKMLSFSFQARLVDTPAPDVQIQKQKASLTLLSWLSIVISLLLFIIGKATGGLGFILVFLFLVSLALDVIIIIAWFLMRFFGKQVIVSLNSIVKDSVLLPDKSPVDVTGMNAGEIAKECLLGLPEIVAKMGELSSCMLAPNIGQDALGKTLARIAPGITPDEVIAVIDTTESNAQGEEAISKAIFESMPVGSGKAPTPKKPVEPFFNSLFLTTKGFYRLEKSASTGKTTSVSADYASIRLIAPKRSKIKKVKNMNTNSLGCFMEGRGIFNLMSFYTFEHDFDMEANQDETVIKKLAEILASFCKAMQERSN